MHGNCVCVDMMQSTQASVHADNDEQIMQNDATWIISSTFIIFTMQSGKRQSNNNILKDKSSTRSTCMPWSSKTCIANKQILYHNVILDHFPLLS